MNERTLFDREDRLFELANRACGCGGLSPAEEVELSEILTESSEARELWAVFWQTEAALEREGGIHNVLADRPENVVTMPGVKSGGSGSGSDGRVAAKFGRWKVAVATAAAIVLGLGLWGAGVFKPEAEIVVKAPGLKPKKRTPERVVAEEKSDPESQYKKLLATAPNLGTGSLVRPNTNMELVAASVTTLLPGEAISFNRHIRPILSDNCFACHGPDEKGRKGKLRLDTSEGATKGGEDAAIVPGKVEASELMARILTDDAEDLMPPEDSHKKLTGEQIALLKRWISEGAVYEGHWAFTAPQGLGEGTSSAESPISDVESSEMIDFFVGERLKKEGLDFSPEARKETLVRRVSLDVTGLPPTLEALKLAMADDSENWYGAMVDRLLASSAYGEHRARYWLDAARYGDTHGLHLDNYREIWPYRDWVIDAFNANMPFDQFTIEQLAGDLLPNATQSQRVATGFNRCNVTTSEGGSIPEEFLVRYAVDRVSTTATVWMGLTAGCAQCHDHKFDPLTMKEFYQLFAYFNNTTQPGMDQNMKESVPSIRVYESEAVEAEATALQKKIEGIKAELKKLETTEQAGFNQWIAGLKDSEIKPDAAELTGEVVTCVPGNSNGEKPVDLGNVGRFEKGKPFTLSFSYALPKMDDYGRVMLLQKTDAENGGKGWRIFVKEQSMNIELIENSPNKVLRTGGTRRFKSTAKGAFAITYDGSGDSNGVVIYLGGKEMKSRFVTQWFNTLEGNFASDAPLLIGGKDAESGHIPAVTKVRIFDRKLTATEVRELADRWELPAAVKRKIKAKQSEKDMAKLRAFYYQTKSKVYQEKLVALSGLETELSRIEARTPYTLVMQEKEEAAKAHILERGEYDQKKDEVTPVLPAFLPVLAGMEDFEPNRLGLAKWLTHPDHPLTARVMVNRMWQELFGMGLVKTSEDFGVQGESPSHPKLLDRLAFEFVKSGWDVKAVYRRILMSRTYRQRSAVSGELVKRDAENRLLARGPRFRLDAEVIRDQALATSGLLDLSVGGPSVKPYQPSGVWKAVGYTGSNTQTFFQDFGKSAEHRRALYSFLKRTAPQPNMVIFDAPNREDCIVRRERTNTPLQALVLMNDPQFMRAARYLALRALNEKDDVGGRLDFLSEVLRGRAMADDEKTIVKNSLDQFQNTYASDEAAAKKLLVDEVNATFSLNGEDVVELASWTMVASQLLNLDEVLNKN